MTTQTIRNGASIVINLQPSESLKVVAVSGNYTLTGRAGSVAGTTIAAAATGGTYGPYAAPVTVFLISSASSEIDFDSGAAPVVASDTYAVMSFDSAGNVSGLVDPVSGGTVLPIFGVVPQTNDNAGIAAAVAKIVASGKPGAVLYKAEDYTITADIPLVNDVSHIGISPKITFVGNVPDQGYSATGGTRMILSAGVKCFTWNNVDKGSDETNIATFSLQNVKVFGFAFIGGAKCVDVGAYRAMGPVFCEFDQLYGFDQTSDFAFDFKNFQHCQFGRIYQSQSGSMLTGGGVRFASQLSSVLFPGNSQVTGEIFTYSSNRLNRSIVIEASGPSGCILNQFKVNGRLQGNRYGLASPDTIVFTTNGTDTISVPDGTKFQVGVPVVFVTTAPTNFTLNVVYFVLSIAGNTLKLVENPYDTVAITAGSSSTYNASFSGWPSVEIRAPLTANSIKNSDFGQIDAEAFGNVCAVLVAKTRNCQMFLAEIMTSQTNTALVTRDSEIAISTAGIIFTQDQSANFGFTKVTNNAGGPFVYSGGSFTLDSAWNGRSVRYTGTSDITITVPNTLPKGFEFEITPTGATGIVTFAAASGGAVFSSGSKLRTLGQYATAKLKNIANKVNGLSGDLQV
jgi:hypothetical protein